MTPSATVTREGVLEDLRLENFRELPVILRSRLHKRLFWATAMTLFGVGFMYFSIPHLVALPFKGVDPLVFIPVGFFGFGLYFAFYGMRAFFWQQAVVLHKDHVIVDIRAPFWRERWEEPLDNYLGVELVRRSDEDWTVWHTIQLTHPDTTRNIVLYDECHKFHLGVDFNGIQRAISDALGVPVIGGQEEPAQPSDRSGRADAE